MHKRVMGASVCFLMLTGCGSMIVQEEAEVPPVVLTIPGSTAVTTTTKPVETTTVPLPVWDENLEIDEEKEKIVIQGVPHFTQFSQYLTACESLATCSLLQYYGIDMTPDVFLDGYLPVSDYPEKDSDGELHAEHPANAFIGDPMKGDAFGCYNSAIVRATDKIHKGLALAHNNMSLPELCKHYIDRGEPVVIWATINMARASKTISWHTPSGEIYTFISPEHALVLLGYDENNYYFCDSLQYNDICSYSKEAVEQAYEALGEQSLVINQRVLLQVPDFWRISNVEEMNHDDSE